MASVGAQIYLLSAVLVYFSQFLSLSLVQALVLGF